MVSVWMSDASPAPRKLTDTARSPEHVGQWTRQARVLTRSLTLFSTFHFYFFHL